MFYGGEWVIVSFLGSFFLGGAVQAGLFRLGTDAVIHGLAHPLGFRTGGPAARVYQVSEVWPCGPGVGVSKRIGFSMMDGRETVIPSAGRCGL